MTRFIWKLLMILLLTTLVGTVLIVNVWKYQVFSWDVVAFHAPPVFDFDIFVMDIQRNLIINLTREPRLRDYQPEWSPDGRKIAFLSNRRYPAGIYVREVFGGEPRQLTSQFVEHFAWSPDSTKIAYSRVTALDSLIYVVDTATDEVRLITPRETNNFRPSWAPDSQSVLYYSERGASYPDIYQFDLTTNQEMQLTDTEFGEYNPILSPDEQYLIYITHENGNFSIYRRQIASGHIERLTDETISISDLILSPYDDELVFTVIKRDNIMEIHAMNLDGTNHRKVMDYLYQWTWQP